MAVIALVVGLVAVLLIAILWVASRYKRCPSDRILVIYGRVGGIGESARCLHGGGALVWPIIQGYAFLDLTPISIEIKLQGALSQQNIRVNTPATFTVGVSTEPGVMQNAAERMLGLSLAEVENLSRDIIFGQMRVVIATMPIEEINTDREKLITNITESLEIELRKVGLRLINVNIQDITDESGYIDALGREAAARAINEAKIKVSQQERDGDIGAAEANREQRIRVASANATATEGENEAKVTVARSDSERRQKEAEAERAATASERVTQARAEGEALRVLHTRLRPDACPHGAACDQSRSRSPVLQVFRLEGIRRFDRHPDVDKHAVGVHAQEVPLSVFLVRDLSDQVLPVPESRIGGVDVVDLQRQTDALRDRPKRPGNELVVVSLDPDLQFAVCAPGQCHEPVAVERDPEAEQITIESLRFRELLRVDHRKQSGQSRHSMPRSLIRSGLNSWRIGTLPDANASPSFL